MDQHPKNKSNDEQTYTSLKTETKKDVSRNLPESSEKRKFDADEISVYETDDFSTSDDMPIQELIDKRVQFRIESRMKAKKTPKSDDGFSTSDEIPLKQLIEGNRQKRTEKESKEGNTSNKNNISSSKNLSLKELLHEQKQKRSAKFKAKKSKYSHNKDFPEEKDTFIDEENVEVSEDECNSDINVDSDWGETSSSDSEVEGDINDDPSSLQWLTRLQKKNEKPFLGPKPGPKQPISAKNSPLNIFYQILPESMFETMAKSTNDYVQIYTARRRKSNPEWSDKFFTPVSAESMKAFVGIRMIMAINQKPNMEDNWSTDASFRNIRISDTMGKRTFKLIQRYFHINDPIRDPVRVADQEKAKEMSRKHPLYKVSPLLEVVRQNITDLYNLHQEVSIDEAMVKCHGQHWGIIGAPNKPAKRGFKVFVAADAVSDYLYDFQVYMRKQKETGLTQRVVGNLSEQIYGRNHIVFVDKYYTSIKLALSLLEQSTYLCGSFNVGRKYWPKDLKESKTLKKKDDKVRNLKRGEFLTRQTKDKKLVATVWKDRKNVFNLNSYYDPVTNIRSQSVIRRQQNEEGKWQRSEIPCPKAIMNFNKFMGGVDRHDHLRSSYTPQRSSNSWWTYFAWFGIDMALINSYLLYKTAHPKTSHKQFHLMVANQLIGGYCDRLRQATQLDPVSLSENSVSNHEIVSFKGRPKVCRYCSRIKVKTPAGRSPEASTGCLQCKTNLHRVCFTAYHELLKRKDNVMDKETQTGESLLTPSKDRQSARKTGRNDDLKVTRAGVKRRLIGAASRDLSGSPVRKSPRKKKGPTKKANM